MGKLKALVAGTGFGCRIQVPALRGAGFEVVGLIGSDPVRTAERAAANGVAASFTDLGAAIAATGADAVAISTPPHSHSPLTLQALSLGCHVLCEKPFARDAAEARAMLAAAEAAGKVHMLGHEFRYAPPRAAVARAIADGMIGTPRAVTIMQLMPFIAGAEKSLPGWWFDPAEGGGWLGASMPHLADQLRCWLGEFESLSAGLAAAMLTRGPVDDTFSLRFAMRGGIGGVIHCCAGVFGPMSDISHVTGSEGSIWIEAGKVMLATRTGQRELPIPDDLALPPPPPISSDPRYEDPRWKMLVGVELAPYTLLAQAFRAAILGEPAPSPVVPATFADGVAAMELIDAVRASAADGGRLVQL